MPAKSSATPDLKLLERHALIALKNAATARFYGQHCIGVIVSPAPASSDEPPTLQLFITDEAAAKAVPETYLGMRILVDLVPSHVEMLDAVIGPPPAVRS